MCMDTFPSESSMAYLRKKPEKERLLTRGGCPPMLVLDVKEHSALSSVPFTYS